VQSHSADRSRDRVGRRKADEEAVVFARNGARCSERHSDSQTREDHGVVTDFIAPRAALLGTSVDRKTAVTLSQLQLSLSLSLSFDTATLARNVTPPSSP